MFSEWKIMHQCAIVYTSNSYTLTTAISELVLSIFPLSRDVQHMSRDSHINNAKCYLHMAFNTNKINTLSKHQECVCVCLYVDCIDNFELSTVSNTFNTVQHSHSDNSTFRSGCGMNMCCLSFCVRSIIGRCQIYRVQTSIWWIREWKKTYPKFCILALALLFPFVSLFLYVFVWEMLNQRLLLDWQSLQ